ncbi:unnamed protein product [Arctogadus glacialis]
MNEERLTDELVNLKVQEFDSYGRVVLDHSPSAAMSTGSYGKEQEDSEEYESEVEMQCDSHGMVVLARSQSAVMSTGSSGKEQGVSRVEQRPHGYFPSLHKFSAHRAYWGQKLQDSQEQLLSHVLDETKSHTQHLAMVKNIILTRFDFWTLGLQRDMEGTILNSLSEND